MNQKHFSFLYFLLLPLLFLSSCRVEDRRFPSYDNSEEISLFYQDYNSKRKESLLSEKKTLLEELQSSSSAKANHSQKQKELKNIQNSLKSPEFFTFSSLKDLPRNIKWGSNWDDSDIGSPKAKKGGTLNTFFPSHSFPPTIRSLGKEANNSFRGDHWDKIEMDLVNLHPETGNILPGIARAWFVSEDKKTIFFQIDEKATWSDGKPVTTEDFFMTFYIALSPYLSEPWYRNYYSKQFSNITRYSDKIFSITLSKPRPLAAYFAGIKPYARHFYREFGPDFEARYNWRVRPTTGAYVISEEDLVKGRSITLRRVKNWWAKDRKYTRNLYNADKIRYTLIRDGQKIFQLFKRGKIDVMSLNVPDYWYEKTEIPEFFKGFIEKKTFYYQSPLVPYGIYINHSKPLFANKEIRIGMQYAINWKKIIDFDMRGDVRRLHVYADGFGKFTHSKIQTREFNPKKAREYFIKAGFTKSREDGILLRKGNPLSFSVTYTKGSFSDRILQRIKEEAVLAGVEIRLDGLDGITSYKKVMEKQHDATLWGWNVSLPYPRYHGSFHSQGAYKQGTKLPRQMTNNISIYANPEVDILCTIVRDGVSEEKIREAALRIEEILHEDAVWIPGYVRDYYRVAHWRWIQWPENFNVKSERYPLESYIYWIDEEKKRRTLNALKNGGSYTEVNRVYDQHKNEAKK